MYLFFLKHSKEHINVCVERKTYKQNETQYKNKSKLTLSLSQIHQKVFIFSPQTKHFKNLFKQDSHISSISPSFCHVLTNTTQTKSKQKTYVTKVKRKQRINQTNESSSIENKGNSPYEEQQLPLRTTKIKLNFSPPIKIGKTKHVLGKIQEGGKK